MIDVHCICSMAFTEFFNQILFRRTATMFGIGTSFVLQVFLISSLVACPIASSGRVCDLIWSLTV